MENRKSQPVILLFSFQIRLSRAFTLYIINQFTIRQYSCCPLKFEDLVTSLIIVIIT